MSVSPRKIILMPLLF